MLSLAAALRAQAGSHTYTITTRAQAAVLFWRPFARKSWGAAGSHPPLTYYPEAHSPEVLRPHKIRHVPEPRPAKHQPLRKQSIRHPQVAVRIPGSHTIHRDTLDVFKRHSRVPVQATMLRSHLPSTVPKTPRRISQHRPETTLNHRQRQNLPTLLKRCHTRDRRTHSGRVTSRHPHGLYPLNQDRQPQNKTHHEARATG